MADFMISDGTFDVLSVTTTADPSGECQVYLNVRDGSGVHISRHPHAAHLRDGVTYLGAHARVALSNVTDEELARLHRLPERGYELGLPKPGSSSAVSYSFDSVNPPRGERARYAMPAETTELRLVDESHLPIYGDHAHVPVASDPPAWIVIRPAP